MQEFSDKEFLELFSQENTRHYAFNLLVRQYQERIYWHIRKMVIRHDDADDLVQNVFIKAYAHLSKFREESKIYTWLYRIATNECITFLNQKKKRFFIPIGDVGPSLSKALESDAYFNGDALQLKLQRAILSLPEKQRLVFNMKYFDQMKYEDMSEILGTSVGALKASYHHAVKKIEEYLKHH
ncbi:MAG: RNA polymerase sigma factor [Bacteroidia bacterium]|jgi:RNA polymerase sigma factor (sigma-70 family)